MIDPVEVKKQWQSGEVKFVINKNRALQHSKKIHQFLDPL